jgi:protein-L-isoaspartate(D-aspartate) O-methyltransferase
MVSVLNEALELEIGQKVLEVGAGSGWHAATIAEIIAPKDAPRSEWGHVYTFEIVQALAELSRKNILVSGYGDRITLLSTDGSKGYLEKAPFDRILVTAAAPKIPKTLTDQLKSGGKMVIPIGSLSLFQNLIKLTKTAEGRISEENLGGVAFAPLTKTCGLPH